MLLGITAATICITGFREKDSLKQKSFRTQIDSRDTTTPGKRNRNQDVELEKAMQKLDKEMQLLEERMKKMDFSKVQKDIDESIRKIDFEKVGKEVEASMAKLDWKKIDADVKEAMEQVKKIDMVKIQEEIKKVNEEMKKIKVDVKIDAEKIKKEVGEAMEKAKVSIEKAKVEIKLMNEFTNALEADKLIDKTKGFNLKVKDGELYIDGKKQPKEVSDKYRKYFKDDDFSITQDGDTKISI